eukprot:TRINITY_DN1915_c0_g1_i1.p1 TRINITY_DN1915_c0_g1~~TRINITY_DN1915_c0_g1_i1.p1  ORF type:complete len:197 (-),score=35.65 TRINITY_DN1915_c0_g1_i1:36-626(-)
MGKWARHLSQRGMLDYQIKNRYSEDKITTSHLPTIGIDFITKDTFIGSQKVTVKIWDTAGQERFRTITHSFYKQAEGILIVYDVTDKLSFESLHSWVNSIHEHANEKTVKYLIANKIDLVDERVVTKEEGEKLALEYKMKYFETSARNDINVSESIESLIKEVYEALAPKEEGIKIGQGKKDKGAVESAGKCCTIF